MGAMGCREAPGAMLASTDFIQKRSKRHKITLAQNRLYIHHPNGKSLSKSEGYYCNCSTFNVLNRINLSSLMQRIVGNRNIKTQGKVM